MESKGDNVLVFDDDISKAIDTISVIAEKYTKCKEETEEFLNKVLDLSNHIKEMKNTQNDQLEANASLEKLIAEQQFTISKLFAVKNDINIYSEEILKHDDSIKKLKEEIIQLTFKYNQEKLTEQDCQNLREKYIKAKYEQRIQILKDEKNAVISETDYRSQELKKELLKVKAEKEEQTNALILDYEEILQRAHAQNVRIRDEMQDFITNTDKSTSLYLKRIKELEQTMDQRTNKVAPNNARSGPASIIPTVAIAREKNINPSTSIDPYELAATKN